MLMFADSSALLKLFLDEPYTPEVRALFTRADARPAVCRIAWVESLAGLARRELRRQWPRFTKVEVTQPLLDTAGVFADAFALRAFDAVQLAAAQELRLALDETVTFTCFDRQLNQAARALGFAVPFAL